MKGDKKTEILKVRVSTKEKEEIVKMANRLSIGISDLARLSIREVIARGSILINQNDAYSHDE